MDQLTERQEEILNVVVREYIATAKPIGSDAIIGHGLNVSSATVRNEFARLGELGYLTKPHTSAGRIPTERGYRYFVERLMETADLTAAEKLRIRHQFHQVGLNLDEWMRLAASVLARIAQNTALIAAPQSRQIAFRHIQCVSISESRALMILVLQDGSVHQQMMLFTMPIDQDTLTRVCNHINDTLRNLMLEDIRQRPQPVPYTDQDRLEIEIVDRAILLMEAYRNRATREIYRDGLVRMLEQPEFLQIERARHVVQVLEEDTALIDILSRADFTQGVQVIIGSEVQRDEIEGCSMVLSTYGEPGEAHGMVGVFGPMRMPYSRTIPGVRYIASLMGDLLHRLYGR